MSDPTLYNIRLHLEPNPGGVYTVTSPDVPGLVTEGSTPDEILANVREALSGLLEAWQELGMETPPALRPVQNDEPQTLNILVVVCLSENTLPL
jgi:antitoxin HicB